MRDDWKNSWPQRAAKLMNGPGVMTGARACGCPEKIPPATPADRTLRHDPTN